MTTKAPQARRKTAPMKATKKRKQTAARAKHAKKAKGDGGAAVALEMKVAGKRKRAEKPAHGPGCHRCKVHLKKPCVKKAGSAVCQSCELENKRRKKKAKKEGKRCEPLLECQPAINWSERPFYSMSKTLDASDPDSLIVSSFISLLRDFFATPLQEPGKRIKKLGLVCAVETPMGKNTSTNLHRPAVLRNWFGRPIGTPQDGSICLLMMAHSLVNKFYSVS